MKQSIKFTLTALTLIAVSLQVKAQKAVPDIKENETIIIRKKGSTSEKINIVVDGDKITVNGKPVEDFKSENIEITTGIHNDFLMPTSPMAPGRRQLFREYLNNVGGNKAFLGVMTEETKQGAKVTDLTKESPAEKSGLKEGDIITKVDNENITGPDDLYKAIGKHTAGDKVTITYKRNDKEYTTSATLTKNKEMRVYGFNQNRDFDFKMMPPSAPDAPYFFSWNDKPEIGIQIQDTEEGNGVKVLDVEPDSPGDKAGLQENDVITQVNGKAVTSVDDLKDNLKDAKAGDTVKLSLRRNNQTQTVDVKFPKDLKTIDL